MFQNSSIIKIISSNQSIFSNISSCLVFEHYYIFMGIERNQRESVSFHGTLFCNENDMLKTVLLRISFVSERSKWFIQVWIIGIFPIFVMNPIFH